LIENVDDDIPVVQENPAALPLSFDTERVNPLLTQFFFDVGSKGLDLAVRIATADQEIIRKRREVRDL
jgi:hypothetical protein